jgi:hypothetical protein
VVNRRTIEAKCSFVSSRPWAAFDGVEAACITRNGAIRRRMPKSVTAMDMSAITMNACLVSTILVGLIEKIKFVKNSLVK